MNDMRIIHARIVLETALHIGSGKNQFPADSPFRRAGDGRLMIPGRAICGCLRSTATRLAPSLNLKKGVCRVIRSESRPASPTEKEGACGCITCQLFGDRYPDEKQQEAAASRLWFYDALQTCRIQTHVRDGVGINRKQRAAARNVKFDYEIVPAGATFDFSLTWEPAGVNDDEQVMLLAAALQEWVEGRGQLGSSSARGLGQFHLEDLRCERIALQTADQLVDYLSCSDHTAIHGSPDGWFETALAAAVRRVKTVSLAHDNPNGAASWFVRVNFDLLFQGQFLSNDPLAAAATGFDHAPLAEVFWDAENKQGLPVISGSSLRGALRSRAERIARTLAALHRTGRKCRPVCDPLERDLSQPDASCAARLEVKSEEQDVKVHEEDLCLACRLFGSSRLGSRLWVRDASWQGGKVKWDPRDFLAIDRFTGGGQEGAKFDAAGLVQPRFQSCIVLQSPAGWELGWLVLILRDMAEGLIPLGFGSAKGFGAVKMDHVRWQVGWLNESSIPESARRLAARKTSPSGLYTVCSEDAAQNEWKPEALAGLFEDWVAEFQKMVVGDEDHPTGWRGNQEDASSARVNSLYGQPWSAKGEQK